MKPLLQVQDLIVEFPVRNATLPWKRRQAAPSLKAVDGVSFHIQPGETVGLVGESGSGKSTIARAIMGLVPATSGSIRFDDRELAGLSHRELRRIRRRMQFVFQDPYDSLSPRMTIGEIIEEPLLIHAIGRTKRSRRDRIAELLELVRLDVSLIGRYPHEFSGGQRQRIGIARALASDPDLLICDEPVSALDVSIQGQIVNLLSSIQTERQLALMFIAHDLAVVEHVSDRILVLYLGRVVESNRAAELIAEAKHPYTKALLRSVPRLNEVPMRLPEQLPGEIPSPLNRPSGCHFHTRCPIVESNCKIQEPSLRRFEDQSQVACHKVG